MISEEIENELEALRAIYGDDFEEREPVWKRPCFCIKVKPTTSVNGQIHVEATVKFTLVNGYPKIPPKVELEANKGLSGSDVKALNAKLLDTAVECTGQEMCHDLISATQIFLEANNIKPQTFYEAMLSREKRETEALKNLRGKELSSDGKVKKESAFKKELKTAPFSLDLPGAVGAINSKMENMSLMETSVRDFRQSTDFINQQRLLSKPGRGDKGGKGPVDAGRTGAGLVDPAAQALAALNTTMDPNSSSTLGSTITPPSARSNIPGKKGWEKLLAKGEGDEFEEDDSRDGGLDGKDAQSKNNSTMGDKNRLVPVIGRAPLSTAAADSSRYGQEFEEMAPLGSGASGQVWKVRNKLDRRIYAIKKIDLNAAENASVGQAKIRREVTTISRLLHKHIVRYYAAWVEESQHSGAGADDTDLTNVTASMSVGASGSSSASSSPSKSSSLLPPAYMSNAFLGSAANNSFAMDDDIFERSQDGQQTWDYDQTEMTSPTRTPVGSAVAQKPVKGSRFYKYGSASSSSNSDDSSSSGSDSDSDSDGDESSSESGSGSSSSDSEDSSAFGRDSEITVDRNSSAGIATNVISRVGQPAMGTTDSRQSGSRRSIPKAPTGPKLRRWMFIQMEYCYTTLREEIDLGQLWQSPAECGKLLRQLLEALAYIHDRRVIHRDLKPANIFLDGGRNIKIGDFGLATFNPEAVSVSIAPSGSSTNLYNLRDVSPLGQTDESFHLSRDVSNASLSQLDQTGGSTAMDALLSNSLTGGIGTAMYRAPEQEFRPKESLTTDRGYDEKADMFSLGIILFEMCHAPFGTGMERLLTMKKLRDNAELPAGFGEAYSTEALASIVRWLVQQQPTQRPSAAQLLESPLLPARVDTDSKYLKEITEALWKPNSSAAAGIISVLFNNSINVQKGSAGPLPPLFGRSGASGKAYLDSIPAVSYDLEILQQNLNMLQPRSVPKAALLSVPAGVSKAIRQQIREAQQKERSVVSLQYFCAVKQQLKEVFESHGAVPYSPGLLQLRSNPGLALMMRNADRAAAHLLGTTEDKLTATVRSPALAQFLDPVGQVVVLPSDLVTPYAKLVAFLNLQQSQRYNISQVFTSLIPPDSAAQEDYLALPPDATAINNDHPFISEEAVYDVVLPHTHATGSIDGHTGTADVSPQLQADFEVLTAAIEAMSRLQPYLPDCAIRVSDPRIMDSIIELCAWQLQVDPVQIPTEKAADRKGGKNAENIALIHGSIDRGALFKLISLASDGVMTQGEVVHLVSELKLPPLFQKRLLPFLSVLSSLQDRRAASSSGSYLQQGASAGRDPLQILDALEMEFYRSEIILDIQRRLASGNTAPASDLPPANVSSITSQTSGPAPFAGKGKGGKVAEVVKAPVTAGSDFTPLDLGNIGKKQVQKKNTAAANNTTSANPSSEKPHEEVEDPFREDRRRVRSIIKTFDASINHLRQLVKAALNCLYGAQQAGATAGSSTLLLLVDLGKDPRYVSSRAGSSNLCPFHARGVYFVIESYLFPSEQFLQQQLLIAKEKEKAKTGLASGQVSSDLALRCSRRRHNRFGGVLGEGGHFDHLVEAYREHFQQVGGEGERDGRSKSTIVACALRLKLDAISLLISKFESRQQKLADHLLSRSGSSKYFFVDRFKPDLTRLLDCTHILDAVVVVDGGGPVASREEAIAAASVLHSVLLLLRRHGIRASDRPHQLQGASRGFQHLDAALAGALCSELGIPFAVVVHTDANNKISLQYWGDQLEDAPADSHRASTHSSSHSATVSLVDLPKVLKECVRVHGLACPRGKFSLQATVASAVESSTGARSPSRLTAAGGNTIAGLASSAAAAVAGSVDATSGANAVAGAGKNQKVRFGSFDIKTSATAPNAGTDNADTPSSVSTGQTGRGAPAEKTVGIVYLDAVNGGSSGTVLTERHSKDWQQFSNPKEKKQAMVKKKEQDHVPNKVRAILAGYAACGMWMGASGNDALSLVTSVRSPASPYLPGVVLVADAPFIVLRNLSTILLTRLHNALSSSTAREEYEALAGASFPEHHGAVISTNYRKQLKQVVSQLCSYAKQLAGSVVSSAAQAAHAKQSSGAGNNAGGSTGAGSSAIYTPSAATTIHVYLYSMNDNQLDFLCCDGKALLAAKLH